MAPGSIPWAQIAADKWWMSARIDGVEYHGALPEHFHALTPCVWSSRRAALPSCTSFADADLPSEGPKKPRRTLPPAGSPRPPPSVTQADRLAHLKANAAAVKQPQTRHLVEGGPVDGKRHKKHPPRLPTRVIDTPTKLKEPEPEDDEAALEKEIKKEEGPQPPKPPAKIEEPDGPRGKKWVKDPDMGPGPEPMYMMTEYRATPAHGACDPVAIFEVRSALESVKADVPAHVCLDPYKEADNALLDLQDGYDRTVAKCGNQSWVAKARQSCDAFRKCITDEVRSLDAHIRPETFIDLKAKLSDLETTVPSRLLWPEKNVPPRPKHPQPADREQILEEEREIAKIHLEPEVENLAAKLPAGATIHQPGRKKPTPIPPQIIERPPDDEDTASTPWTEPGSYPSLIHSQMPLAGVVLGPGPGTCASLAAARRRSKAEGFLW